MEAFQEQLEEVGVPARLLPVHLDDLVVVNAAFDEREGEVRLESRGTRANAEAPPTRAGQVAQFAASESGPENRGLPDRIWRRTPSDMGESCPTADCPPSHQSRGAPAGGCLVLPAPARRTVPGTPVPNRRHEPRCPSRSHSPPRSASPSLTHVLVLNLLHPAVGEQRVGCRVGVLQKRASDAQPVGVEEVGQLLPHGEPGELLVLEIAGLLRLQPLDLAQVAKGPVEARVQFVAGEVRRAIRPWAGSSPVSAFFTFFR